MGSDTMLDTVTPGARALAGMLDELAAADELITELVAENEELRSRLARRRTDTPTGRDARCDEPRRSP